MNIRGITLVSLGAAFLAIAGAMVPTPGQSADIRQYIYYVGYNPGGQFDTYARIVSRHMERHMPKGTSLIIKYMPGAGSRKLAQYIYAKAPKDGSEFGQLDNNVLTARQLFNENIQYTETEFTYLGSPSPEPLACIIWHEIPVKTVEDAKQRVLNFGTGSANTIVGAMPLIINKSVGTQFKTIAGYGGGAQQFNAMEKGELDARCTSVNSILGTKGDWVRDGKLRFLVQFSPTRDKRLGDTPLINDLVKTKEDRDGLNLILAIQKAGFPLIAPPGIPADKRDMLRAAFSATMKDPKFVSDATRIGMLIEPIDGDFSAKTVSEIYKASKETVAHARRLLK